MPINIRDGITFSDILLVPKFSTIERRSEVDISVKCGDIRFEHSIIPANMKTIIGTKMAHAIIESGGLAILHRFMTLDEQLLEITNIIDKYGSNNIAASVGIKDEDKVAVKRFIDIGCKIICIDIAHGDSQKCVEMISYIKAENKDIFVIAGNVATGSGAERLWKAGADAVKGGVGAGSICLTRIETGNGVPQLTALIDIYQKREELYNTDLKSINRKLYIIADGGIKNSGDVIKAMCFSDMVMVGNLFAGCAETPGQLMQINGKTYKEYVGSSTHKNNHIEGVEAIVPVKGTYKEVLTKILEGVRSGCSYQGVHKLSELQDNPEFIRITNAGLIESNAHDVIIK